jgi:uncharacterized LabA/DUF88 family protein
VVKRANIYVDGFNLYYGALKGTPYKWLDLEAMSSKLVPSYEIHRVRYFTARISERPGNLGAPRRQTTYLRALAVNPKVSIHYGRYQVSRARMPLSQPWPGLPRTVEVLRTEEKGTDVHIATYLMLDAFHGDADLSVLVSNDADLALPMRMVASRFSREIGIINPFRRPCRELVNLNPSFYKELRKGVLRTSQLPSPLSDANGTIRCPERWLPQKSSSPAT